MTSLPHLAVITPRVSFYGIVIVLCLSRPVVAADAVDAKRTFDVPAGEASVTLKRFAQQAGQQVIYPAHDVREMRTNAVKGELTAQEGIAMLLADTGLQATFDEQSRSFAISKVDGPNGRQMPPAGASDPSASPKKKILKFLIPQKNL